MTGILEPIATPWGCFIPPTDEFPVHGDTLVESGSFWACTRPESPGGRQEYDMRCRACALAAWSLLVNRPELREGTAMACDQHGEVGMIPSTPEAITRWMLRELHGVEI